MDRRVRGVGIIGIALCLLGWIAWSAMAGDREQPDGLLLQFAQVGLPSPPTSDGQTTTPRTGTPAMVIDDQEIDGILGKAVRGNAGEDMGRIVNILINRNGHVRAAIIDFGGFLGVGNRKIAVDWNALRFPESGRMDRITLDLNRDQVMLAPEYKPGEPVVVLGASGAAQPIPVETPPKPER
jgi:PRC-barrel domain